MDTEKQLNDLEEQLNNENSVPKKIKIVIGILITKKLFFIFNY